MSAGSVVAGLRELAEKATARPWRLEERDWPNATVITADGDFLANVKANGEFAVAAVNALPALLALADGLEWIAENAESWHGDDAAKGRALAVIAQKARESVARLAGREGDTG